jgi:hypothetical protein
VASAPSRDQRFGHGYARGRGGLQTAPAGQFTGLTSAWHVAPPSSLTIVSGSVVLLSGHAYLIGGGGLHITPLGHSVFTAAEQPSPDLKIVQLAVDTCVGCDGGCCVGGWLGGCVVGWSAGVCGRGGFSIGRVGGG